jgi:hypothetical protein
VQYILHDETSRQIKNYAGHKFRNRGPDFQGRIVTIWKFQQIKKLMNTKKQQTPTNADFARVQAQSIELSVLVATAFVLRDSDPDNDDPHQFTLANALAERIFNLRLQLARSPVHLWCMDALEETQNTEETETK